MHFITKAIAVLGFTSLAFAQTWAQFCNDDNCSEGCGASVMVDNPGCLTQYGRRSVKFHGSNSQDVSMVASPGPYCDCQNYCETEIVNSAINFFDKQTPGCFKLRDEAAQSFRFIFGGCPADQC